MVADLLPYLVAAMIAAGLLLGAAGFFRRSAPLVVTALAVVATTAGFVFSALALS